jgi:protease IV
MKSLFRLCAGTAAVCLTLVLITLLFVFIKKVWFAKDPGSGNHVAVVDLSGMILTSSSFIKDVDDAVKDHSAKSIVVRINSPGGLVAPSQEMFHALQLADAKKPVIISMGSLAASGGFYAALGGRKIYASPGTLTASIGVIMELVDLSRLYNWAKVERFTIKAGKFKDAGTPNRPMTPQEKDLFNAMLADVHRQFKADVKTRRKLTDAVVEEYADGRVMTGSQAKQVGFVDVLGGFEDAVVEAKKLGGLPEDAYVKLPEGRGGLLRRLLSDDPEESLNENISGFLRFLNETPTSFSPRWQVLLLAPVR